MDIKKIWWESTANAARLCTDVIDCVKYEQSAVIEFNSDTPWTDEFRRIVEEKTHYNKSMKRFECVDAPIGENPGDFIMNRYCTEEERAEYWPTKPAGEFLANNRSTVLNNMIVYVRNIDEKDMAEWNNFLGEYINSPRKDSSYSRGVFVLETKTAHIPPRKNIRNLRYSDYVSDYDMILLCLSLVSGEKCSGEMKRYIAECACSIGRKVERSAKLASCGLELVKNPIEEADNFSIPRSEAESALWEAQIKYVFPKIEAYRRSIVKKYRAFLETQVPVSTAFGEFINVPDDLEIGHLFLIFSKEKNVVTSSEYASICKLREIRNKIAHLIPLDYDSISEIIDGSFLTFNT